MKRVLLVIIALSGGHWSFAELPQSLDQVLFGISGGTNYADYVKWMANDGVLVFQRPFSIFDRAEFFMYYPTNGFAPRHYSIEMEKKFTKAPSPTSAVSQIQSAECILQRSFKGQTFKRQYDGVIYRSSCINIDGLGWNACFFIMPQPEASQTSYVARASFYNPFHKVGRFVSCEDFADAGKMSETTQETFDVGKPELKNELDR